MSLAGVVLMYGMTVFSTNEPKPKSGMCVIQDCKNIFNDNKKKGSFVSYYYYYHHFIWGCVLLTNLEI